MTPSTLSGAPRGTDTLPRDLQADEPSRGRGVLAVVGSLLLLLGVPVALVLLVGNPLPTSRPTTDWLKADVTPQLVIDVLAVLVWVVWVHFVVCFLSEWRALRAGRMPGHVIAGGGSQLLARRLVASILLLSGGASVAHGLATSVATPAPLPPTHVAVQTVEQHDVTPVAPEAHKHPSKAQKYTEVRPPNGRHHDTLWGIAERTLGDPLRWKEIWELNKERVQPDGRRLTDADLIQPNWQLLLPPTPTARACMSCTRTAHPSRAAPRPVRRPTPRRVRSSPRPPLRSTLPDRSRPPPRRPPPTRAVAILAACCSAAA